MNRRGFMASCAAAAGAVAATGGASAQESVEMRDSEGLFADAPLRIAPPLGWFDGDVNGQLEQIAYYGFEAYEWLGPSGDLDALKAKMDEVGVALTCIGGAGAIAPGQMVDASDHDRLEQQFRDNVAVAHKLGVTRLIGLSGNERDDISREEQTANMVACLKRLAPIAEGEGITIVIEALNPLVDHVGFFLTRTDQTMAILEEVDSPNVKMLFDIYHQQITEGNVIRNFTQHIDRIGHFHVADNPGRQEPGTGELNYRNILKALHGTGYDGYVALESGKSGTTDAALRAVRACLDWS